MNVNKEKKKKPAKNDIKTNKITKIGAYDRMIA